MTEFKANSKATKESLHHDNTTILSNFRTIKKTPKLQKILELKEATEKVLQTNSNLLSNPDFQNVDEQTNHFMEKNDESENINIKKRQLKKKFISAVKKVINNYRNHREERVYFLHFSQMFIFFFL